MEKIIALIMSLLTFSGFIKPLPPKVASYSEEELSLLEEHLRFSEGATVSLYADKDDADPVFTGRTQSICGIPEGADVSGATYARATAWIAFDRTCCPRLRVDGAAFAEITVSYNELRKERCTWATRFLENVFYRIDVAYPLKKGSSPVFRADAAYRLSVDYPSFGGVPSEPLTPMADIHLRDPYIMLAPDGRYYMTGTYDPADWSNTKEIHVYRSDDLKDWTDLGAVWSFERDATWQKKLLTDGTSPIWAPELHYINGDYYICYSLGWGAMNGGVLKSTTGKPEGPYADVKNGPVFDAIDSTFFTDDDGKVYALWSDGRYARMKDDMTGFRSLKLSLVSKSGQPVGFEGCFLFKNNGFYYLCSASYTTHYRADGSSFLSYDSYYAVSRNLAGPYSERRLLLVNGGHNNLFLGKDGTLYTTAFSGSTLSERPAIKEIETADNGLLSVR
ncbi:MAG: family 43 glycosylhydrolase [Clostridia bacterium]|nr:family 43 glycosylhydrolase [Clostridia bacterium]